MRVDKTIREVGIKGLELDNGVLISWSEGMVAESTAGLFFEGRPTLHYRGISVTLRDLTSWATKAGRGTRGCRNSFDRVEFYSRGGDVVLYGRNISNMRVSAGTDFLLARGNDISVTSIRLSCAGFEPQVFDSTEELAQLLVQYDCGDGRLGDDRILPSVGASSQSAPTSIYRAFGSCSDPSSSSSSSDTQAATKPRLDPEETIRRLYSEHSVATVHSAMRKVYDTNGDIRTKIDSDRSGVFAPNASIESLGRSIQGFVASCSTRRKELGALRTVVQMTSAGNKADMQKALEGAGEIVTQLERACEEITNDAEVLRVQL